MLFFRQSNKKLNDLNFQVAFQTFSKLNNNRLHKTFHEKKDQHIEDKNFQFPKSRCLHILLHYHQKSLNNQALDFVAQFFPKQCYFNKIILNENFIKKLRFNFKRRLCVQSAEIFLYLDNENNF